MFVGEELLNRTYTSSFILCISIPCSAIATFWCIFQKGLNTTYQVVLGTQIDVLKPCASSYQRTRCMHPNILPVWSVCVCICVPMYVWFLIHGPNVVTLQMKRCSILLCLCTKWSFTGKINQNGLKSRLFRFCWSNNNVLVCYFFFKRDLKLALNLKLSVPVVS